MAKGTANDRTLTEPLKLGKAYSITKPFCRLTGTSVIIVGLGLLLLVVVVFAVGVGAYYIPPGKVIHIFLSKLNIITAGNFASLDEAVIINIRLPRVVSALIIGSGLSVAGVALQALFRNPLADPALIGISGGSAFGAFLLLIFGSTVTWLRNFWAMPLAAFAGGLAATLLVYHLSLQNGRSRSATMLLAGIAVNALCNSGIGFLSFTATDSQLRSMAFWTLGSLGAASWQTVFPLLTAIVPPSIALGLLSVRFNALLLGESEAGHLGINVQVLKEVTVVLVSISVGASVAMCGIIGFIGLVVPHVVRLFFGADHKTLFPLSALAGAILLTGADLTARTVVQPAELPIGIITSIIGTPFFIWLLMRDKKRTGWMP